MTESKPLSFPLPITAHIAEQTDAEVGALIQHLEERVATDAEMTATDAVAALREYAAELRGKRPNREIPVHLKRGGTRPSAFFNQGTVTIELPVGTP